MLTALRMGVGLLGLFASSLSMVSGGSDNDDGDDDDGFEPITSKAAFERRIKGRLKRFGENLRAELESDHEADLAAKLKPLNEKVTKLTDDLKASELTRVRDKVALKHNLPDDIAELLKGDSEDDLEAHAKTLAKHVKTDKSADADADSDAAGESKGESDQSDNAADANADAAAAASKGASSVDNDSGVRGSRRSSTYTAPPPYRVANSRRTVRVPGTAESE